jgi:hypothetical protein
VSTKKSLLAWFERAGYTHDEAVAKTQARWEERKRRYAAFDEECRAERAAAGDICDATMAETMVRFLSHRFGIRMPRLNFTGRSHHGGFCHPATGITIAPVIKQSTEAHEFAHHLDSSLNRHCREGHSQSSYFNLKRVVDALGMDYPWGHEYLQVQRWAKKDSLLGQEGA